MTRAPSPSSTRAIPGPQRRRRWSAVEKLAIVAETHEPGATVTLIANRHGIAINQLFTWRRLARNGALVASLDEETLHLPVSVWRAQQDQIHELERILGKKTMEAEVLKETLEHASDPIDHSPHTPPHPKNGVK